MRVKIFGILCDLGHLCERNISEAQHSVVFGKGLRRRVVRIVLSREGGYLTARSKFARIRSPTMEFVYCAGERDIGA